MPARPFPRVNNINAIALSTIAVFCMPEVVDCIAPSPAGAYAWKKPEELAEWVLSGQSGWSRDRVQDAMQVTESIPVKAKRPIQVAIMYSTATVMKNDEAHFFQISTAKSRPSTRNLRRNESRHDEGPGSEKQFRRVQGHKQISILIRKLEALTLNTPEAVKRRKAS